MQSQGYREATNVRNQPGCVGWSDPRPGKSSLIQFYVSIECGETIQVRKYYPDEWEKFSHDPYTYRAPRAENYHDLCGLFRLRIILLLLIDW